MFSRMLQVGSTGSFVLFATLASTAIVSTAFLKNRHPSSAVHSPPAGERRVQVVRFTLYDTGIYPQEARVSPGPITISIEDLTGSSDGLIIERVDSTGRMPVGLMNKTAKLLRMRKELQLPKGSYEVIDSTRKDNRALLIVTTDEL